MEGNHSNKSDYFEKPGDCEPADKIMRIDKLRKHENDNETNYESEEVVTNSHLSDQSLSDNDYEFDNNSQLHKFRNLNEFDILDETRDSEEYSSSDYTDYSSDSDMEVPDDEVEIMLEEGLPKELCTIKKARTKEAAKEFVRKLKEEESRATQNLNDACVGDITEHPVLNKNMEADIQDAVTSQSVSDDKDVEYRTKTFLEEIELNHFELMPEGWIKLTHKSGMPVYLHRKSRVCSLSRPYYLGPDSARNHSTPLSAVPCLQYRRALENEKKTTERLKELPNTSNDLGLRSACIETAAENLAAQSVDPLELHSYCKSLFRFKTVTSMKFNSWATRRRQVKQKKQDDRRRRLTLSDGTKLLKFPIIEPGSDPNNRPYREWVINPTGKSYVCILHEYVQHAIKKQPSYEFKELENPSTPYSATVIINGTQYGTATGVSKKQAKTEAARVALEILVPEMKTIDLDKNKSRNSSSSSLSIFNEIKIEDPRVAEFCAKTAEPSPYAILLTCLQRNYAMTEVNAEYSVNKSEHKKNVFTMTVGSHTAAVPCKNKRDGKQRASQAILQALHPHITNWGSLLRLYGNRSVKNVKEKKQEEQEITSLQSKALLNEPNYAILEKLKTEMRKLRDKKLAIKPIGKFVPPDDVDLPLHSSADLNKISL